MGHILFWAIIRFTLVMFGSWAIRDYVDDLGQWWVMFFTLVTVVVIYPAQLAYRKHSDHVQVVKENSLCATCKNYVPENTLCAMLDEHVSEGVTPCQGMSWEPVAVKEYAGD